MSAYQKAFTLIPALGEEEAIVNHHIGNLNCLLAWENLLLGKTKFAVELAEKAISYSQDNIVCKHPLHFISCLPYIRRNVKL